MRVGAITSVSEYEGNRGFRALSPPAGGSASPRGRTVKFLPWSVSDSTFATVRWPACSSVSHASRSGIASSWCSFGSGLPRSASSPPARRSTRSATSTRCRAVKATRPMRRSLEASATVATAPRSSPLSRCSGTKPCSRRPCAPRSSRAFVSADGRTTFVLAYAPPKPGSFGQNPAAAKAVAGALRRVRLPGGTVHVSGFDALNASSGQKGGLGILAEGVLGGIGALLVLAFVFASLLAFVPLIVGLCSIMTSFLLVWGLTSFMAVSGIVGFLIALVGLGVAIDYSLLIVVRWREERAHGHAGEEAVERAIATAGRAVVFSGTTVAIGLLSLAVLPVPFLRSVGVGGMLIPLVGVVVAVTLLPVV